MNTDVHKFVVVHNHPYVICATPSDPDMKVRNDLSGFTKILNKELLDYCVYTEYDYYSLEQDKNKKEKIHRGFIFKKKLDGILKVKIKNNKKKNKVIKIVKELK